MASAPTAARARVDAMLAQIARDVAALPEPYVRQLLPIMAEARRELAGDLARWLKHAPKGDERWTAQRYRENLLQLDTALSVVRKKLPTEIAGLLGEQGDAAAALALANLKKAVVLHAKDFGGDQKALPLRTAALVERGAAMLMPRYQQTLERYGAEGVGAIKSQLAIGMMRNETFAETTNRLIRNAGGVLKASMTLDEQARALAGGMTRVLHSKAERIVRTEGINAVNALTDQGIDELEADDPGWAKKWDASQDSRTCPICGGLDGKLVAPGKAFEGARPTAEGDVPVVAKHPPAHPRCRCALVAWRVEWDAPLPAKAKPKPEKAAKPAPEPQPAPKPVKPTKPKPAPKPVDDLVIAQKATPAPKGEPIPRPPAPAPVAKPAPALSPADAWVAAVRRGDLPAAREVIQADLDAHYGLAPQEWRATRSAVKVIPIEEAGGYLEWDGTIALSERVGGGLKDFAAASDADRVAYLGALRGDAASIDAARAAAKSGRPQVGFNGIYSANALVHESIHGYGAMTATNYSGPGAIVEEIATETMSRRYLHERMGVPRSVFWAQHDDAPGVTPIGAYGELIDSAVTGLSKEMGIPQDAAALLLEDAALKFKRLGVGAADDGDAMMERFVDQLPAKARAGMRLRFQRLGQGLPAEEVVEVVEEPVPAPKPAPKPKPEKKPTEDKAAKPPKPKPEPEKATKSVAAAKEVELVKLPPPAPYEYSDEERAEYKDEASGEIFESRSTWANYQKDTAKRLETASKKDGPVMKEKPHPRLTVSERAFYEIRNKYADALPRDELDACLYYSHQGDRVLNSAYRYDMLGREPDVRRMADRLNKAIRRYEMPEDTYVARGLGGEWAQKLGALLKPGDTFAEPGFCSTSATGFAEEFAGEVLMRIKVPKGAHAAPLPTRYPDENEFLLPAGTKFRVISNKKRKGDEGDIHEIEVEVIP